MTDSTDKQAEAEKLSVIKATAVRQAMFEIVGENRSEIIKRAVAKLSAMGIKVQESEMGQLE